MSLPVPLKNEHVDPVPVSLNKEKTWKARLVLVPVKKVWPKFHMCSISSKGRGFSLTKERADIFLLIFFLILRNTSFRHFSSEPIETYKNLILYHREHHWFQTDWPGGIWVPTYHALHFGKAALPADIDEPGGNDDHTDWANNHQDDEQFAVIAARLAGSGVARAHAGEVLNADLKCDFH